MEFQQRKLIEITVLAAIEKIRLGSSNTVNFEQKYDSLCHNRSYTKYNRDNTNTSTTAYSFVVQRELQRKHCIK